MLNLLVNWTTVAIVVTIVAVIAIVFAILIVLVSKLCFVKEDEKIEKTLSHLAGANCGGCGFNGCADFAKALVEKRADLSMCGPSSAEGKKEISKILDIPFEEEVPSFAVVKCSGGDDCKNKFIYVGNDGCVAQHFVMGGTKNCTNGCLGGGTCETACPYHAISVKNGVAVADKATCASCGLCKRNCPKQLIELIPKTAKVYVACSSHCKGKDVMDSCKKGCIGCTLCAKNCPENAITMVDNLPVIDYSKCSGCLTCVAKCPRKTIKEL